MKTLVREVTHPGDPATKRRPRLGRGGNTYTPAETRAAEDALGWTLKLHGFRGEPDEHGQYVVACRFYTRTRRRSDLDNMIKLVLDACNGIVWADDHQVVELAASVRRSDANPRTEMAFYQWQEDDAA